MTARRVSHGEIKWCYENVRGIETSSLCWHLFVVHVWLPKRYSWCLNILLLKTVKHGGLSESCCVTSLVGSVFYFSFWFNNFLDAIREDGHLNRGVSLIIEEADLDKGQVMNRSSCEEGCFNDFIGYSLIDARKILIRFCEFFE